MKLFASAALAVLSACPAWAQPHRELMPITCGPTEEMEMILSGEFSEVIVAQGTYRSESRMLLWLNAETGSWTITKDKDGKSCIVAAGGEFIPGAPEKDGDPV